MKNNSGHPSVGNITNKDQALEYVARKVFATPTTSHIVAKNYANVLTENGHCITSQRGNKEGKSLILYKEEASGHSKS